MTHEQWFTRHNHANNNETMKNYHCSHCFHCYSGNFQMDVHKEQEATCVPTGCFYIVVYNIATYRKLEEIHPQEAAISEARSWRCSCQTQGTPSFDFRLSMHFGDPVPVLFLLGSQSCRNR